MALAVKLSIPNRKSPLNTGLAAQDPAGQKLGNRWWSEWWPWMAGGRGLWTSDDAAGKSGTRLPSRPVLPHQRSIQDWIQQCGPTLSPPPSSRLSCLFPTALPTPGFAILFYFDLFDKRVLIPQSWFVCVSLVSGGVMYFLVFWFTMCTSCVNCLFISFAANWVESGHWFELFVKKQKLIYFRGIDGLFFSRLLFSSCVCPIFYSTKVSYFLTWKSFLSLVMASLPIW